VSRNQRLGLIAGAIVVLVAAFLLIRPTEEKKNPKPASRPAGTTTAGSTPQAKPKPPEVSIRNGKPAGGVKTIEFTSGETARIDIKSNTPGEVHLHGYDIEQEVKPGETTVLRFKANIEGIFALEDHASDAELAKVRVNPK
jgi:FtsP/CotA-like multicopper oxidase with cupredoxin domain